MMIAIFRDVTNLFLVMLCLSFPFALAFYLGANKPEDEDAFDPFSSLLMSVLSVFRGALGDFDASILYASNVPWLNFVLYAIFLLTISVVLLNLLIAMMSDTYEMVKEDEKAEFLLERGRICLEYEHMLSGLLPTPGPWMHILRPSSFKEGAHLTEQWRGMTGKIDNMQRSMAEEIAELKAGNAKLETGNAKLKAGQAKLEDELKSDLAQLKVGNAELRAQLATVLVKLLPGDTPAVMVPSGTPTSGSSPRGASTPSRRRPTTTRRSSSVS